MINTIKIWGTAVLLVALISGTANQSTAQFRKKKSDQKQVLEVKSETVLDDKKQAEFEFMYVEALKQKMFGNTQQAVQLLSSCLEIDPNSSAAMYELATIHAANNDLTSSTLLLEKAISINPGNKWYKLLLAQNYQQLRKFAEAAAIYDELLKLDPEDLDYLYMKAVLLSNSQQPEKAIQVYNKLETKLGVNEQISVAKQQLYLSQGKTQEAFKEINKLISSNPQEAKYYGLLADMYQNMGDSVNALIYYHKIQEVDPENGFVHFSLANYYLQQGNLERSYEETKKGFKSDQIDIQSKLQLFMMLTENPAQTNIDESKEEDLINILVEQYPDEFMVHALYAESLLRKKKLAEARVELQKALEIEKNDYMIWERILFIDNDLQEWNELYNHSNQLIELFPNQPNGYLFNAIACIQLEKFSEAEEMAEEGLTFVVDNPQLQGQLLMLQGEALYKQDKVKEAFKLFDKTVELDKENYIAMNNYAYYLSLYGQDLDKAERMSGKVIERFPNNPTYLDTHAWVLFRKGDYTLAKFYMESAISNGGDTNATLLEHYGDILIQLKKVDEAVKQWQKAKESGGDSEVLERKIREKKYIDE